MVPLRCQPLHTITSSLARVVSKPIHGLTNLNQVHICTPSLNLTGVMESELMASQAFPACYLAKGCPSDHYKLVSRKSRENSIQAISTTQCHNSEPNPRFSLVFKGLLNNLVDYNARKSIYSTGQVTLLHK